MSPKEAEEDPEVWACASDGFVGTKQGEYRTREGTPGLVLQQLRTGVVHVYAERRLTRVS